MAQNGTTRAGATIPPPPERGAEMGPVLLVVDVLMFLGSFALAMHLRFTAGLGFFEPGVPPWAPMLNSLPIMVGAWLFTLWVAGLYNEERLPLWEETWKLTRSLLMLTGILLTFTFFYRGFSYSRGFTALFVPSLLLTSFTGRIGLRLLSRRLIEKKRFILVGATQLAEYFLGEAKRDNSTIEVVGVVDDGLLAGGKFGGVEVLGAVDALESAAARAQAEGIIICARLSEEEQADLLERCLSAHLEWHMVPTSFELMLERMRFEFVAGVPVLGLRQSNIRGVNRLIKRAFDVLVASTLLVLLSPLLLVVAGLIKLTSKGPIFFTQDRVGEGGRNFKFLKFRTMHVDNDDSIHRDYAKKWIQENEAAHSESKGSTETPVYKLKKDPRVIPVGHFLRRFSVDELPQLINVLKGDMSLIGPRPPIPYEVDVYHEWHKRRFAGPQGITGLWQVSGRNRLSFDEMVKLDIEYVENWSLGLDFKILWRTVGVVLFDRAY